MVESRQLIDPLIAINVAIVSNRPGEVRLRDKLKQVLNEVFAADELDFLHSALTEIPALLKSLPPNTPMNGALEVWADEKLYQIYH